MSRNGFYNLSAGAKSLSAAQQLKHKKLIGCIERFADIWSVNADLKIARSSIAIMLSKYIQMNKETEPQSEDDATIGGALFCRAVIFYARATDTASKARRPSGIRDLLPDGAKKTHINIMKLRNDALAHYGGKGDGWAASSAVMHLKENHQFMLMAPNTVANYFGDLVHEFSDLIDNAISACSEKTEERTRDLVLILSGDEIKDVVSQLMSETFDPSSFFSHKEAADEFYRLAASVTPTEAIVKYGMRASHLRGT